MAAPARNYHVPTQNAHTRTRTLPTLMMASLGGDVSPRILVSQGMEAFRKGDIRGSIDLFDEADSRAPDGSLTPYLWQRGLSLYYADRFEDASKQVSFVCFLCSENGAPSPRS